MLADEMMRDIARYTENAEKEIYSAAVKIQREMLSEVRDNTPVRTGTMKRGWVNQTYTKDGNKVFAVRNKAAPKLVHIVNFTHAHFSHGKRTGSAAGTEFVNEAQEQGIRKLDEKIKDILG